MRIELGHKLERWLAWVGEANHSNFVMGATNRDAPSTRCILINARAMPGLVEERETVDSGRQGGKSVKSEGVRWG